MDLLCQILSRNRFLTFRKANSPPPQMNYGCLAVLTVDIDLCSQKQTFFRWVRHVPYLQISGDTSTKGGSAPFSSVRVLWIKVQCSVDKEWVSSCYWKTKAIARQAGLMNSKKVLRYRGSFLNYYLLLCLFCSYLISNPKKDLDMSMTKWRSKREFYFLWFL